MCMSTVRRARLAAVAPLLAVGLLHCTFGNLDALGSGSTDAAVSGESATGEPSPDGTTSGGDTSAGDTAPADGSASPAADASPGVADSSALDAGSDAGDAGGEAETGPLVPLSAPPSWLEAGTASWCTQFGYEAAFCADFDETPLPSGFSAQDGAFLAETSSASETTSGPNNLLLYVPPQPGSQTFGSKLSRQFQTSATTIALAFDIKPESLNTTSSGLLFAALDFTEKAAPAAYSLRLAFNSGFPRLEESYLGSSTVSTPPDVYHTNFTLPMGVWSRVEIDIDFGSDGSGDAGGATETIFVGGLRQGIPETLAPPAGFDARPNLLVGAVYGTSPTAGWAIRYDNVTLTLQ
jgi:hypothetical protein